MRAAPPQHLVRREAQKLKAKRLRGLLLVQLCLITVCPAVVFHLDLAYLLPRVENDYLALRHQHRATAVARAAVLCHVAAVPLGAQYHEHWCCH